MSCKPMYKVQEDVASLKQLLSIVSNGLQRNACAVEKLKKEMTQVRSGGGGQERGDPGEGWGRGQERVDPGEGWGGGQERVVRYVKGQEYTKGRGKVTMPI